LLDGHVRHCLVGGHGGPSDPNEQVEELMGAVGRDELAQAETGTFSKGTGLTTPSSIRVKGQAREKEETRGDFTMRYASPSYDGPVCALLGTRIRSGGGIERQITPRNRDAASERRSAELGMSRRGSHRAVGRAECA